MSGSEDGEPVDGVPDLLIGTPERDSAREALDAHLVEKRLDPAEFERRVEAVEQARTRSELMRVFADLPVPHPELPAAAAAPAAPEEQDPPPIFLAGCLTLTLGLVVAVVLGFVYGAWWALAVPIAVTVAMIYVEQVRTANRGDTGDSSSRTPDDL
ncbi:DUF1707 domain-containing protein [Actinoplanes sp. NPDC024001]|uniref:DUF1707 SHOCT-like domain-containing protein n=1 Tax=Actinoplanes sp. NPDC024001 TaxID=3154598 RepID=UPI00340700FC